MKTDEITMSHVGDRLLTQEVLIIDSGQRSDGWHFDFVLDDYSVIALSEKEFNTLFTQGKIPQALFGRVLVESLAVKLGSSAKRMELEHQVNASMLGLLAVKDNERVFGPMLSQLTGGKINI